MKTLYLLRHAEAEPNKGGGDFERALTLKGFERAKELGVAMRGKNYAPAFIMCSAATRTVQTLEGVLESVSAKTVERDKKIYHAAWDELLEIIKGFDDHYDSALVVGHNPTVHELAASLAADEPTDHLAALARAYAPGMLTIFQCPAARWEDLRPGKNALIDLI